MLTGREPASGLFLDPGDGLLHVDWRLRFAGFGESPKLSSDPLLGITKQRKEDHFLTLDPLGDDPLILEVTLEGLGNDLLVDFQKSRGPLQKIASWEGTMPLRRCLIEKVLQGRPCTQEGVGLQAQFLGNTIGGMKADAVDVPCEPVGIGPDHLDRLRAIALVDPDGAVRAESMRVKKEHDVTDHFLLRPRILDSLATLPADALDFLKAFGLVLDDVEDLIPEFLHELGGIDRADPLDHAAAEVFLDPLQRSGGLGLELMGLQLDPMLTILFPGALCGHPFAGRDRGK